MLRSCATVRTTGLLAAIGIFTAACAPVPPPATPPPPSARKTLRVVTLNNPVSYYVGSHGPAGLDYELANELARQLDLPLQIVTAPDAAALRRVLEDGIADIAAAQLTAGNAWEGAGHATQAYAEARQLLVYRRGQPRPKSLTEAAARGLFVIAGSPQADLLASLRGTTPALQWRVLAASPRPNLPAFVARGLVTAAIVDAAETAAARPVHPELAVAFELPATRPLQLVVARRAVDLLPAVEEFVEQVRRSGALTQRLRAAERVYGGMRLVAAREFSAHIDERLPLLQPHFEAAAEQSGLDWRLIAALAYQESQWNARAASPDGALGVMMLMPPTAAALGVTDPFDARSNIIAGAKYFVQVREQIPRRIPEPDRTWLAVAAYNMGYGHLEDGRVITQMRGGNPDRWADVRENLPLLSDELWYLRARHGYARGLESRHTVERVQQFLQVLENRAALR